MDLINAATDDRSATMPLDDRTKGVLAGLIQHDRGIRDEEFRLLLRAEQGKAAARGILGAGFYAQAQAEHCAGELQRRAERWLSIGVRVFSETREQWNEDRGRVVAEILARELETDFERLYGELKAVTGNAATFTHNYLAAARDRTRAGTDSEIALLVLRHDRLRVPLLEQLSAARYSAAHAAWTKALAFANASPPDDEKAISEAVGAVEAVARIVVGDAKPTLGECIKLLRQRSTVAAPLLKGFEEIWGFASEAENVRHGGGSGTKVTPEVADYVLTVSSACLGFLLARDIV